MEKYTTKNTSDQKQFNVASNEIMTKNTLEDLKDNYLYYTHNLQNKICISINKSVSNTKISKIINLINEGRGFEALYLANLYNSRDGAGGLYKANFNPDEPRGARARWVREGSHVDDQNKIENVQYRGYFHDFVVNDLLNGLTSKGGLVLKNVVVMGINGTLAIPDGASKPPGWLTPYFIEVKTGFDPDFTPNQKEVYPLICIGGHASSADPRIVQLGLTPGVPFPPLPILLVHTYGPGMPLRFENYCFEFGFWRSPDAP